MLTWRLGHLVPQRHVRETVRAHKSRQLTARTKQSLKDLNLFRSTGVRRDIYFAPRFLSGGEAHDHLRLKGAGVNEQVALREAGLELQSRAEAKVLQAVQLRRFDGGGGSRARGLAQELSPEHEDFRGQRHEAFSLFRGEVDAGLFKVPPECQSSLMRLAAECADYRRVRQNFSKGLCGVCVGGGGVRTYCSAVIRRDTGERQTHLIQPHISI
jgi:hypothetical protein